MSALNNIKKVIMIPVWLVQLITTSKSFEANPIIGSRILNRMGLHVLRLVLSHGIMGARMYLLSFQVSKEDRQFYRKNGYLLKTDFLAPDEFEQVLSEASNYDGETREGRQGNTLTQRAVMSPEARQQVPAIAKLLESRQLARLAQFTAGTFRAPFYYIEQVRNHYAEGEEDPQKRFHTDTFHPTMKCWYFLEDVTLEKGPFTYIPESNRLTWARIKMEYRNSILGKAQENRYAKRGSIRYRADEIAELGLPEEKAFVVPANSLVIANTFGIHKRTESEKSTRLSIYGDSRTNPFNPIPGMPSRLVDEWQYKLLDLFRVKADRKAAKRGGKSPWYIIGK
ncbi:phytanoyl-CoA dioxygenase [Leucothrix sargassi]|nr:phytanoyl-CoA dioxygenase [Leucothrix sargassi]